MSANVPDPYGTVDINERKLARNVMSEENTSGAVRLVSSGLSETNK